MYPRSCGFARYRHGLALHSADLVVGGYPEVEDHVGTLVADAPEMPGMVMRRLRRAEPDVDRNAGGAQFGMALPGHFRVGILDRRDHAGDPGGNDGVRTGRRLADMRAWLQRRIERGASRSLAGALERLRFGV